MSMSTEQLQRLMELLGKLAENDPLVREAEISQRIRSMAFELDGPEHRDARTLFHLGWIRSRRHFGASIENSWSSEGIYAFDLTDDGRAVYEEWRSKQVVSTEDGGRSQILGDRPLIMMIHGSTDGVVPRVVDDIRLWCYDQKLDARKAADYPNLGRAVREKVDGVTGEADYYIVVLTADEELARGGFRPRENAIVEMVAVWRRDPSRVCVLKDPRIELPSDYRDIITEQLDNWQSILHRELRAAGLL